MNTYKKRNYFILSIAFLVVFTGCATSKLQTQSKMSQTIFLTPVEKSLRIVYVDVKNTSGQEIDNVLPILQRKLQAKGYTLTDNPQTANYILVANILFANNKQENNAKDGAILGTVAGIGVANQHNRGGGRKLLSGVAGGAIGGVLASMTEDTIIQMLVDISVKEKTKQSVSTSVQGSYGEAKIIDGKRAGFMNTFGGDIRSKEGGGVMKDNINQNSSQNYTTNYIEKRTRIFAEATRKDLTLEEALPILGTKIASQIAAIF